MSGAGPEVDLFAAVAAAAEGIARVLTEDPASAVLFWGSHSETEVVHRHGGSDDLCGALSTSGGPHIADVIRRAGRPLRLGIDRLSHEAEGLRASMRANDLVSLALFPLFGEYDVAGCLVVPLGGEDRSCDPSDQSWLVACRVLDGLRLVAATAALRAALAQDRRRHAELPDGVLVVDRSGRVAFADGLLQTFPGWNRADPFGRSLESLPGARILSTVAVSPPGRLLWVDDVLPSVEGRGIPVALSALPFGAENDPAETGRIYFLRDLRPDRGSDVDGAARMLELGVRVTHGADTLSHAVNLAKESVEGPWVDPCIIDRFRAAIEEARRLVRRALDRCLSETDQGSVQVNDLMREVVRRSNVQLEEERVRVYTFLRPDLPAIPGDRLGLFRALVTLVHSARESLRPGGGSLTLRTWSRDGWVYAAVSDDGGGRRREVAQTIEPLFETLQEDQGEELGLAGVREIVARMGGRLLVESRPGVWTRITLMLREERRSRRRSAHGPAATVGTRRAESRLSVLVVDDNAALRSVLRRYLERRGHDVTEAVDGSDGLRIVEGRDFDRIIVDIRMPGKDGPAFFEDLVGVSPAMRDRTIFMTGGFVESSTASFIDGTGRPSIEKPFDLAKMARTLEA